MKRHRKKNKRETLARISVSAGRFNPDFQGLFPCPTCFNRLSLGDQSHITEAHIVPEAAGGRLTTFLCHKCNSNFGSKQDLWFGEYLHLLLQNKLLIQTRIPPKKISINGVEVPGVISRHDDGIDIITHYDRMSPASIAALTSALDSAQLEVKIAVPIEAHEWEIWVGFLTAAYLLWFRELGYSWVFQSHLQTIRKQILNPDKKLALDDCQVIEVGEIYSRPWIGFMEFGNNAYPICGIGDRVVVFRSYHADLDLPQYNVKNLIVEKIRLYGDHGFSEPIGLIYRDEVIVLPDIPPLKVARYLGDGQRPQILHRVHSRSDTSGVGADVLKIHPKRCRVPDL